MELNTHDRLGRIIHRIERYIYESPYRVFVAVVLTIALVKTGVWMMPNIDLTLLVAHNPLENLIDRPGAAHLFTNWLSPALAHLIGIRTLPALALFYLLFSVLSTATFLILINASLAEPYRRTALLIYVMLPVSTTAYYWIGMDAVTMLLLTLFVLFRSRPLVTLVIGTLFGLHHFPQGFVAIGAVAFVLVLEWILPVTRDRVAVRNLLAAVTGVLGTIIGKVVFTAIVAANGIVLESTRMDWTRLNFTSLLRQAVYSIHIVFFSVFGVAWIYVLFLASRGKRTIPFFVTVAGLFLMIFIVADQTRVLSIVTFPLITIYLILNADVLADLDRKTVAITAVIWVIVPYIWVFGGEPKGSVLPYDLHYIAGVVFDFIGLPQRLLGWPF